MNKCNAHHPSTIFFFSCLLNVFFSSCGNVGSPGEIKTAAVDTLPKNIDTYTSSIMVPALECEFDAKKNVIYTPTILFAWKEIDSLLLCGDDSILSSNQALNLILNSKNYMGSLMPRDYKSTISVSGGRIEAVSSFEKSLPFGGEFSVIDSGIRFNGVQVEAFGLKKFDKELVKAMRLVFYKDDNNFILRIDAIGGTIFLAKGFANYTSLAGCITAINGAVKEGEETAIKEAKEIKKQQPWSDPYLDQMLKLNDSDKIYMPKIKFNVFKNFKEFSGSNVSCKKQGFILDSMKQSIDVSFSKTGLEVKSKGEMYGSISISFGRSRKPKKLVFDKPFIILANTAKKNDWYDENAIIPPPFFVMKVENSELMIKQ